MTHLIKCALIEPNQRSEIIFSTAHHRALTLTALVNNDKQKSFFDDVLLNTNYSNITFSTFTEYVNSATNTSGLIIIADVPQTFEILSEVIAKAEANKSQVLLLLLKVNKKYLNMVEKKLNIQAEIMQFSANKFVGINDKLRELVQQNFDMNRAGFYAYGSYINYFNANLLKKIFRTDQIQVDKLARGFGFTTPPRVKDGKFLTQKARQERRKTKNDEKKLKQKLQGDINGQNKTATPSKQSKSAKKQKKIKKSVAVASK